MTRDGWNRCIGPPRVDAACFAEPVAGWRGQSVDGPRTSQRADRREASRVSLRASVRAIERATRPVPADLRAALDRRWQELPAHARTPVQALGRHSAGCEGTHGVFPRCDLACTPCYHSREANRVRTDGAHTAAEVDAQMALLRRRRGPGQHAQLIGGEVTLLPPADSPGGLVALLRKGAKPMSMSHGAFDYDYLEALALDPRTREP